MLKRIVMQLRGKIIAPFIQALVLHKEQLLKRVSNWRVSITQASLNVGNLFNRLVQIALNFKVWLANLTIVAQSIKAALINAKVKLIQIGQQLLIIARRIRQLAITALLPKKGKVVGITKSARLHLKGNKTVQTHTANQLIQDGLKLQGHAKPPLQPAKPKLKKGR
jgi:hypothetical protein